MKTLLLILCALLFSTVAHSQVSGRLTDTSGSPLPFATVVLLKSGDSVIVRSALSDEKGHFVLNASPFGTYLIKVSSIGYANYFSSAILLDHLHPSYNAGTILLKTSGKQLNEVVIRANKPLVQQEAGGLVVNVQNSIMTKGSSVLQVLTRSPGVIVNAQTSAISLNGKSGVMVMVDGKLLRLSADQIAALLNGMTADDIDKIELLTTPPAKYDADGNAGLINIVTKKNKRPGTSGSLTASAGYGKGDKVSADINLNHNSGKVSLHASYSYAHDHYYSLLLAQGTENVPIIGGQTNFNYNGQGDTQSGYQGLGGGLDYHASAVTTIGGNVYYSISSDKNIRHNFGNYVLPDSNLGSIRNWRVTAIHITCTPAFTWSKPSARIKRSTLIWITLAIRATALPKCRAISVTACFRPGNVTWQMPTLTYLSLNWITAIRLTNDCNWKPV